MVECEEEVREDDTLTEQESVVQEDGRTRVTSTRLSQKHGTGQKKTKMATGSAQDEQTNVFVDADAMKAKVRQNLSKPKYNVRDYYKDKGFGQAVARSYAFEVLTLGVIAFNALWIAIDTDLNDASMLLNAHPVFQIAENLFCAFFSFEWTVRFLAFKEKKYGLKDPWFMFDSLLVLAMVLETWVMNMVILFTSGGSPSGGGDSSIMRIARLLRLSRMTRMARLLRAMPELMILIKGMMAATRSVLFTLLLMTIVLYVFGIAFKQLADGTDVGERYFGSVTESMFYLLIYGALMDSIGSMARELAEESHLYLFIFFFFVLLAALTVMNMLIGVLCEVVSAVAATEKEEMLVSYVNGKLHKVVSLLDEDGTMSISKKEFANILDNMEAVRCLQDVGVDVVGLVDLTDAIFNDGDNDEEKELSFGDFMEVVLQLRGSNNATVRDIVDLRKIIRDELRDTRVFITRECAALMTGTKDTKKKKGGAKKPLPVVNSNSATGPIALTEDTSKSIAKVAEAEAKVKAAEVFSVDAMRFLPLNSFQDLPAQLPQTSAPTQLLAEAEPFGRNVEIIHPLCTTLGQVEAWSPGQNVGWAPLPQPPRLSETPAAAKRGWKKPNSKVPLSTSQADSSGCIPEEESVSKNDVEATAGGSRGPANDDDAATLSSAGKGGGARGGGNSGGGAETGGGNSAAAVGTDSLHFPRQVSVGDSGCGLQRAGQSGDAATAPGGHEKAAAPQFGGGSGGLSCPGKEEEIDLTMSSGVGFELQLDQTAFDLCASEVQELRRQVMRLGKALSMGVREFHRIQDGLHKEPTKDHEKMFGSLKGTEPEALKADL